MRKSPDRKLLTRSVETFDTPSGLGGSFTVSVLEELAEGRVLVRVHYPTRDWDGFQFAAARADLKPTGKHERIAVPA